MAVTEGAIAYFAKRYKEVTGTAPKRFVCPITLRDDPDAELCYGHVLCDKLKSASKLRVVQREDVDNRLGSLIESDFVKFANFREAKSHEIFMAGEQLIITSPSGERMPAFFAGNAAKVRFHQIEMYDDNGNTVATPYLRSHTLEAGQYKQLQVEWMFYIHKYCFTAAMLKSAYLNMFRVLGYSWVLDMAGEKVRRVLAASFNAPDQTAALNEFSEFEGCCWVTGNSNDDKSDSLSDDRLFFHFTEGDFQDGLMFGISSLFHINGIQIAVTVPAYNKFGHYFIAWDYYQKFIREHRLCHNIHFGRVVDNAMHIDPSPLSFRIVEKIPPDDSSSFTLSPCYTTNPQPVA